VLLATVVTVFSFDLSNAVDANLANNGRAANLSLFQASILDIPVREATFDKVICLGVLQHTADPEKTFFSVARYVKPGGDIAIDIYARRLTSIISWKYLLRPITKRISKERLFRWVERVVDVLLPTAILLRRLGGRWGARMLPIVEYSHLGISSEVNREWATLDTFDMYSPVHDHPRSIGDVRRWFDAAEFIDVIVEYGPNGVIARGRRPLQPVTALARSADGVQPNAVNRSLSSQGER
jgi:SAM-dependent methyltransferase